MFKKNLFIIYSLFFSCSLIYGQFTPGEIGYDTSLTNIYAVNKINFAYEVIDSTTNEMLDKGDTTAIFEYDTLGKLIREIQVPFFEEDDTIINVYEYLNDGRITKITGYGYDEFPQETTFEYDKNKHISKVLFAGEQALQYSYMYNSDSMIVETFAKGAGHQVDDNGEESDVFVWQEMEHNKFEWNTDGTLMKKSSLYNGEPKYIFSYKYNAVKELVQYGMYYVPGMSNKENLDNNVPEYFTTLLYDKNGLTERKVLRNYFDGKIYEYKYLYESFK